MSDGLKVSAEGYEALIMAFKELGKPANKLRTIRNAEKKSALFYLKTVKNLADKSYQSRTGETKLGDSYKFKQKRMGRTYVDVVVGTDSKQGSWTSGGGKGMTYPAIASIFSKGTSGREKGDIKPKRNFVEDAYNTEGQNVLKDLTTRLFKLMQTAVKKAGFIIPLQ